MDLRQLEAFSAVMTVGSITGAGQILGKSQPAITRLIRDFEDELGFTLFERNGPKVTPTSRAFELAPEVEEALAGIRQLRSSADHLAKEEGRELRLVATPALAAGLVPAAVAALPAELQPETVHLRSLLAERAVQAVLSKTIDLGVVSLPLEHRGADVHWIGEAPCVAVVREGSRFARTERISMASLVGEKVISLSNPYRLRRRIDRAFAEVDGAPAIVETNSSANALQMARAGLGIAIVDPVAAYGSGVKGISVRPLDVDIPFFFGVITPYAHPLSATARALIQVLEDTARKLVPGFVRHELGAHDALLQRIHATNE